MYKQISDQIFKYPFPAMPFKSVSSNFELLLLSRIPQLPVVEIHQIPH